MASRSPGSNRASTSAVNAPVAQSPAALASNPAAGRCLIATKLAAQMMPEARPIQSPRLDGTGTPPPKRSHSPKSAGTIASDRMAPSFSPRNTRENRLAQIGSM